MALAALSVRSVLERAKKSKLTVQVKLRRDDEVSSSVEENVRAVGRARLAWRRTCRKVSVVARDEQQQRRSPPLQVASAACTIDVRLALSSVATLQQLTRPQMSQLYASTSSSIAPRRSTRQPVPVSHGASSASLNDAIAAGMSSKPNAANAGQQARSRVFVAHPLTRKTEPLPPFHPVHHGQARATTYPSRLRLGTTSLLQPLGQNGQVAGGGGASAASAIIAKRTRGTAINYAELETLDDPAPSPDSDDDGQTTARGRRLAAKRKQEAAANAAATPPPEKKAPAGGGRSFLGQVVPPNLIHVEQARKTRHQYACVCLPS